MAKKPDEKYGLFINGEFRDSKDGKFFDTYSPATKERIASVAEATKEDVDDFTESISTMRHNLGSF